MHPPERAPDRPAHDADELEDYLRGGTALSLRYRRAATPVPTHALDRRVLGLARGGHRGTPCLPPLAFAASVLLSLAMVTAIVIGPKAARHDDAPRVIRTALNGPAPLRVYSSDPSRPRMAAAWLRDIDALRRAGRNREADAEYRRFLDAYPAFRSAPGEHGFR